MSSPTTSSSTTRSSPILSEPFNPSERYYALDGGFSTQLSKRVSLDEFRAHPLWTSFYLFERDRKNVVTRTHEDFLRIGHCDIITTNTYQVDPNKFTSVQQYLDLENAVDLADIAILKVHEKPRAVPIAGSIGPYGACQCDGSEYTGSYIDTKTRSELSEWHKERIKRLAKGGVDVFAVETIPSVEEGLAVLDVIDTIAGAKCWLSFQCRNGSQTARGEKFELVVRKVLEHPTFVKKKLLAIGINCTSPKYITPLLKSAEKVNRAKNFPDKYGYWRIPYVVYSDSGDIYDPITRIWREDPELQTGRDEIVHRVREWMLLGATIIGGCCRIDADRCSKIKIEMSKHIPEALKWRMDSRTEYPSDKDIMDSFLKRDSQRKDDDDDDDDDDKNRGRRKKDQTDPVDNLWPCQIPFKNSSWYKD